MRSTEYTEGAQIMDVKKTVIGAKEGMMYDDIRMCLTVSYIHCLLHSIEWYCDLLGSL